MRRELEYTISDEEDDDAATYVHKLSQTDGDDVREAFCLAGIPYSPGELAELHGAIHEMLRMRDQHRDALIDGAEQQIPQPAHWGDPFKEGRLCGEMATNMATPAVNAAAAGVADLVSADDVKLLGMLSHGVTLGMGHPAP